MEALLTRRPSRVKRLLDVAISGTALLVAAPAIAAIAVAIKLTDHGPIIFRQSRSGLGGRPFQIYKFRTMCVGADKMKTALRAQSEQDGPAFKMTHDPRVTAIGQFLRKTSLDELPQLFNVLKGDMSLVGPRPLPIDEQNACDPWHRARLDVMPGLTCVWQVKGRSRVSFDEWMRMDLSYTKNYQVTQDLKLIVQTIPAVLLRRGAK
jgi:lipopolysaccharide/colanic/teichoic acid biosynthesis glycosyltransferase